MCTTWRERCIANVSTSHDQMAPMMNVNARSFREKYKDCVDQVKRSVLHYVKTLQELAGEREAEGTAERGAECLQPQIKITENGYPILPSVETWERLVKLDLEALVRYYLNHHYSEPQ